MADRRQVMCTCVRECQPNSGCYYKSESMVGETQVDTVRYYVTLDIDSSSRMVDIAEVLLRILKESSIVAFTISKR